MTFQLLLCGVQGGEGRECTGYDLLMGSDRGLVSLKVQVEEMGRE